MTRRPLWTPLFLAASGWLALLATGLPGGSAARVAVTLAFLLVCPGAAVLALVRPLVGPRDHSGDAMESTALAVALSVGLGMLVTAAFFLTGTFALPYAVAALAGVTTLAALGSLLTARRGRDGHAAGPGR